MALNLSQAIAKLADISVDPQDTEIAKAQLRDLIAQVSVEGEGDFTLLYSGYGATSQDVVAQLSAQYGQGFSDHPRR